MKKFYGFMICRFFCAVNVKLVYASVFRSFHSAPGKKIQLFDNRVDEKQDQYCRGCGWEFQHEDPSSLGYLPPDFTEQRLNEIGNKKFFFFCCFCCYAISKLILWTLIVKGRKASADMYAKDVGEWKITMK